MNVRRATHDDYEAVRAFTSEIWADRGGDYIPSVYHDWLEEPDETGKKTFLAEVDCDAAGIVQAVMLSDDEAWFHGMRVAPQYRRQGVSSRLNEATFEWARKQGATIARVLIFSWNTASLGMARASGFEPLSSFRFAHPDPDSDADIPSSRTVSSDPTAAWRYWTHSNAREHLRGLGLAPEESWSMRELTRADFERFADETAVFAVLEDGGDLGVCGSGVGAGGSGVGAGGSGVAYRTRTLERELDDDTNCSDGATDASPNTETIAEYGVGAWDDLESARALFGAIARDAAALEADSVRVAIPETAGFVTDAAYAGATLSDEPDFVLGIEFGGATDGYGP